MSVHITSRRAGDVGNALAGDSLTESTPAVDWRAHDPKVLHITQRGHADDADHSKDAVSVAVDKRSLEAGPSADHWWRRGRGVVVAPAPERRWGG